MIETRTESERHTHAHGPACGHKAVKHNGHTDYLHDGHLHNVQGNRIEEHTIEISPYNPLSCTPNHQCGGHEQGHIHGPNCGHEPVPHGNHLDYLVQGHLHYPHQGHCDDHGELKTIT